MSELIGRTIMRYIDEQAEAVIASGAKVERIEMDWPHFHALRCYARTVDDNSPRAHPPVPVVVVPGSKVVIITDRPEEQADG